MKTGLQDKLSTISKLIGSKKLLTLPQYEVNSLSLSTFDKNREILPRDCG